MCVWYFLCVCICVSSVFPLSYVWSIGSLLLCRYSSSNIPTTTYLHYSLVYSPLSLPYVECCTYHGVRRLYSYIDYLSPYIHLPQFLFISISLRTYSILLLLYAVLIRFLSFTIYLFLDMCRGVSHILTSYTNFHPYSSLPVCLNFTKNT